VIEIIGAAYRIRIDAYCRVMRWPLRPHEVKAIRELDEAYVSHWHSQQNNGSANLPTLPRSSGAAINPDVFDAVFS